MQNSRTETKILNEEHILDLCQRKDWDKLRNFLLRKKAVDWFHNMIPLYELLITAIYEAHSPKEAHLYGLARWDDLLFPTSYTDGMHLLYFSLAYSLAEKIDDKKTMQALKDYVLKNKYKLNGIFKEVRIFDQSRIEGLKQYIDPRLAVTTKDLLQKQFGNIETIVPAEYQKFIEQEKSKQDLFNETYQRDEELHNTAIKKLSSDISYYIEQLLELKETPFEVECYDNSDTYPRYNFSTRRTDVLFKNESLDAIMNSGFTLKFARKFSTDILKDMVKKLEFFEIKAKFGYVYHEIPVIHLKCSYHELSQKVLNKLSSPPGGAPLAMNLKEMSDDIANSQLSAFYAAHMPTAKETDYRNYAWERLKENDAKTIETLIKEKKFTKGSGLNYIDHAVVFGSTAVLKVLLQNKFYVKDELNEALANAALKNDTEALTLLLSEDGASPNLRNQGNFTPLMLAAAWGKYDACQLLVTTYRAETHHRHSLWKQTALEFAEEKGHANVVSLLKSK